MKWAILLIISLIFLGCEHPKEPEMPPQPLPPNALLMPIVKEYQTLGRAHGVKFTHATFIGFDHIKEKNVIGWCKYAEDSRTILIDANFYLRAPPDIRRTLIFHELTHCLCSRDHDYDKGQKYFPAIIEQILLKSYKFYDIRPGYYPDECPLSIMHPIIVENRCVQKHKAEYDEEMFHRCTAW